jgi:hypothetical protein
MERRPCARFAIREPGKLELDQLDELLPLAALRQLSLEPVQ